MYAAAKRPVHTTIDFTHLPFSDGTLSGSGLGLRPPSASVASHAARRPVLMPTTGCTARLLLLTLERLMNEFLSFTVAAAQGELDARTQLYIS